MSRNRSISFVARTIAALSLPALFACSSGGSTDTPPPPPTGTEPGVTSTPGPTGVDPSPTSSNPNNNSSTTEPGSSSVNPSGTTNGPVPTSVDPSTTQGPSSTAPSTTSDTPVIPVGLEIAPFGGLFEGQVQVTITAASPTAQVRYTTDGSVPTETSPLYEAPLSFTESTQLQVRTFEPSGEAGTPVGTTFIARSFDATSDLPLIVVDGYGGGKPDQKIDGKWVSKDAGVVVVEPVNGQASLSQAATLTSRVGYHVRGQSSASFEKAPYKIEFWDSYNEDYDLPLLGMPAQSDWALIGPYEDRSLVRHAFVYELGRRLGLQAPKFRFAEVYINQDGGALEPTDYEGVYMVVETIKNASGRLDLKQLRETDTTLPKITGGYIFKFDWSAAQEPMIRCSGAPAVEHAFGQCPTEGAGQFPATVGGCGEAGGNGGGFGGFGGGMGGFGGGFAGPAPSTGDPTQPPTCWADLEVVDPVPINAEQTAYLTSYITDFNTALHQQPKGPYADYIDVASFVDTLIINEFTRNGDAYTRSVYFHKDRDQKIVSGPLWDFNLIMAGGGALFCNDNPVGWAYEFRNGSNDWFQQLIADPSFAALVRARWAELRSTLLSQSTLESLLAEVTAPLSNAVVRDFERWPVCQVAQGLFAVPQGETWQDQLQVMRDFMRARGAWLDSQWLN